MSWTPKQTVVVPIDFSDQSFAAVDVALDLVDGPSHLHVIHVLPALQPAEPGVIWNTIDDESRRRHAQQALEERLADDRYAGIHMRVEFGNPGREITEFAEKINADVIVLPSHGRTGLKRLLIGSVAERVMRLAHCSVLVLRA